MSVHERSGEKPASEPGQRPARGQARTVRSALIAAVLAAWLTAPIAGADPVRSMLEMREDRVVVQEWDLSCGAAVLTTILVHEFGIETSERDVAIGLMSRQEYIDNPVIVRLREGFSLLDMARYVKGLGLKGEGFGAMTFEDLERRAPVIVPISRHGYNHFVIFRGARRNRVLIGDPSFGTRTLTRAQFERMWQPLPEMGRVGFTVSHSSGAPSLGALDPTEAEFFTFS